MLRRLIEVSLPLKEVSEQSGTEKRQISAMHMWWARRPLAACRAVVFASLIPDPDDPECPARFRTLVNDLLPAPPSHPQDAGATPDTPRTRCLEFIKHLVKWENSNNAEIIGKARKLIAAAHKFLHPGAEGDMPKVLDPFAGGGAIPLEALRLGCEAHAIDLNPVAHLIELCTLVYPQKYGQPNSRPTPEYIKKLEEAHRARKRGDGQGELFGGSDEGDQSRDRKGAGVARRTEETEGQRDEGTQSTIDYSQSTIAAIDGIALKRLPLITEAEYQKNPLSAEVKFWGHWVLEKARDEIGQFYPPDPDGSIPVAYLWARTVKCPNPACCATIPLARQFWLCKEAERSVGLHLLLSDNSTHCRFEVADARQLRFDPGVGTLQRGSAHCPFCHQVADARFLRDECAAQRIGEQLLAVVMRTLQSTGKSYRATNESDESVFARATEMLEDTKRQQGADIVPTERISRNAPRRVSPPLYGIDTFGDLFNARQALALTTISRQVRNARRFVAGDDADFATAVGTYLAFIVDKHADYNSRLVTWHYGNEQLTHVFNRQAIPMVWDYCEASPFSGSTGGSDGAIADILSYPPLTYPLKDARTGGVSQSSSRRLPHPDGAFSAIATDPPYYDSVPYADLSDYFYVWLKRTVGDVHYQSFRTPLSPKQEEIVEQRPHRLLTERKDAKTYERMMTDVFSEMHRVLANDGIACVMFAHKTTSAWETIIAALIRSGLRVTSSWPFRTEQKSRMVARGTAALTSSVTLVCRKRIATAGGGYWDDVRDELRRVSRERLDFFWQQGIRGADFFISAIGPALSVYGRYAKVTRLTGEPVSVGQFLDEVRGIVTDYALSQILHGARTGQGTSAPLQVDAETRFYVLWKWSYADAKVPADEAFKLAQALGIGTESMWDRTGVLEKQGENVQALTVAKRMRINDLGEPNVDGSPAPLIDALHRCCAFRDKGDTGGLSEYLARSGHGRSEKLWTVAQAISEVLPDGDKEKQLLQGLLNQREKVEQEMKEGRLF